MSKNTLSFIIFFFLFFFKIANAVNLNIISVFDEKDGIVSPAGITTDSEGNVYIADYGKDKIIKIDKDLSTLSELIAIKEPISVAYYQNKLFIVTEKDGGFIFDLTINDFTGTFGRGYDEYEKYKNLYKPADIAVDSINGLVLVIDLFDKFIKPYDISTGNFANTIGLIGGPAQLATENNGRFYLPTSLAFDVSGKLIVADTGNYTPFLNKNALWNPFKRQYITSSKYSGTPKGKVQFFVFKGNGYSCSVEDNDARQFLLHGTMKNEGYVLDTSSIFSDADYLYVLDSINKKIFIFDNAGTVYNSTKDLNTTPKINYPVAKPVSVSSVDIDNDPDDKVGFIRFHGAFGLGSFDGKFVQFKDMVKFGNRLYVTDLMGRVFCFYVN